MNPIKLLLAFLPWLAFWFIAGGHSMLRLQIGIYVAVVLVIVMSLLKYQKGMILWVSVIFFLITVVFAAILKNIWFITHLGIFASGSLFLGTLISMFVGHPFTESYAKEHVPENLWNSPSFIRSSFIMTSFWALIFLANTMVNVVKLIYPHVCEWTYNGIQLTFLVLGVFYTHFYAKKTKEKREKGML
ncbi:MAG: hypothetical protein ABII18_10750 [bacterium]|nr:hypothetical protein [bacterium]MBU1918827.1 hypothetical protein [bacterium]